MHNLFYIGLSLRVDDDVAKTGIKWVNQSADFRMDLKNKGPMAQKPGRNQHTGHEMIWDCTYNEWK